VVGGDGGGVGPVVLGRGLAPVGTLQTASVAGGGHAAGAHEW
jgi:hypothetical protein